MQLNRERAHWRTAAMVTLITMTGYGCAGMNPDARKMLYEPASCDSPQADIKTLEDSRPGGFKRFTQGIQAIAPPIIVLSLLRDVVGIPYRSIYLDHWRVAFGTYDHKIDHRVEKLQACSE
jgi:hypothetical protein